MKLALISDIHANLPALEAVLADIDVRNPDQVICLGDLVGYNVWPNEVVAAIRDRRIPTISGNYDEGVGLNSDDCGCAYKTPEDEARGVESITYTNGVIDHDHRAYLRSLPRHLRLTFAAGRQQQATPFDVLLVHGSPRRINEYLFEDRPASSFLRMLKAEDCDVMCFGHTHKPFHRTLTDEECRWGARHVVNTGSVGKPKDGDPRAGYVILDIDPERSEPLDVEFIRVEYDVERAARAVEESPLPNAFAEALRVAR
jgi:putative phosphoesterase